MRILLVALLVAVYEGAEFSKLDKNGMIKSLWNLTIRKKHGNKVEKLMSRIKEDVDHMPELREKLRERNHTKYVLSKDQEEFLEKVELWKEPRMNKPIEDVNAESGIADALFQGDMLLSKEQQEQIVADGSGDRFKRQARNDDTYPVKKWPSLEVKYALDRNLGGNAKIAVKRAAEIWTNNTCINITLDEDERADELILVYKEYGCWGEVGKQDGWQFVSLGNSCATIGIAAHEIGHALGFWHTHSRPDRDQFITLLEDNVKDGWKGEFDIKSTTNNTDYALPYDYGSVMHYGSTSGGKNTTNGGKLTTMIPKDVLYTYTLGSHIVAFSDLRAMNMYYNCTDSCKNETMCDNGGFAHPRDCSKCICPSGYGGRLCKEMPPDCGNELNATSNWTQLKLNLSEEMDGGIQRDGYKRCNYWIKAPAGKSIEIKVAQISHRLGHDGCIEGGVEIKAQTDQRLTGYRICSGYYVNTTLRSNLSTVPVIGFARRGFGAGELDEPFDYDYGALDEDEDESEDGEESEEEDEEEHGSEGYEDEDQVEGDQGDDGAEDEDDIIILEYRYV